MHPHLVRLASSQGGAFTRTQAEGYHHWSTVRRWERTGLVIRETASVLRLADRDDRLVDQLRRLEIEIGQPAIACSFTAAALHGFGIIDDRRLHITTASGWSAAVRRGVVMHQAPPRSTVICRDGVFVIDSADTAVDVAAAVSEIDVLAALDAALRAGVCPRQLDEAVAKAKGRRGIAAVRAWAPYADPRAESPMESRTRYRILDGGLPAPDLQIELVTPSGKRFVDAGWREYRLGVDYEGEEFHTGTGALGRDRGRHNAVTDSDWQLFYPVAATIYHDHHAFLGMLARALGRAGCPLTGPARPPAETVPRPRGSQRIPEPVIWS